MGSYHCHVDLVCLVVKLQGNQDVDKWEVLLESVWYAILVKDNIRTNRRYSEPYLDIHLLCEFLDLCNVILAGDGELEAVEEHSVSAEGAMADESFQRGKDLLDGNLLLGEVHDNSVGEDLLVDFICIVKGVVLNDFPIYFLIPVDHMLHVAGEGNVNDVLTLKKLVCCDVDKACCLSDTLLGYDYSKIALAKSAIYRVLENPQWAYAVKLL